jgi:hypothetical protein
VLVALAAIRYPAVAVAAVVAPDLAGRVYWRFPLLNAMMGFALFVAAASRWLA